MDEFLGTYDTAKLTQDHVSHLKRLIMSNESEAVIKSFQQRGAQQQVDY
jgi:hypothetical protein